MKKLFFCGALLIMGTGGAAAQGVPGEKSKSDQALPKQYTQQALASADPKEAAGFLTALMVDKLSLSAEQSSKLQEINATRLAELRSLWLKDQGKANKAAFQGLEKRYNADLKAALTPKQYAQYEALVAKYQN